MNAVAITMLVGDRAKYLGIVFGVMLATTLIIHQLTIFTGLMARTWSVVQDLSRSSGVEIMVAHPQTEFLNDARPLADTDLQRVRSVEGIEWAVPMIFQTVRVRLGDETDPFGRTAGATADSGRFRTCIVVGLDDASLIGGPVTFSEGSIESLRKPDAVVIDRIDAAKLLSTLQPDGTPRPARVGDVIEVNDSRAVIAGVSNNTRPFLSQPILYTTRSNAARWAPPERRQLSYVLVKAAPGTDPRVLQARITDATGLAAYSTTEFGFRTVGYFLRNTGIPVNFGITIILGAIVGVAIAGQTFYLFILDNLKTLATLKAMGATNRRLLGMTLLQAGTVGVVGYGLGVLGALALIVPFKGTELEFKLYWQILVLAGGAIATIVALATCAGARRALTLEPAIVFKG